MILFCFTVTYFEWNETFIDSPRDIRLVALERNLIDIVWEELVGGEENLPEYPGEELIVLEDVYTGKNAQEVGLETAKGQGGGGGLVHLQYG